MKCLVVDPSPTMTRVIRNILRGAGADEILCAHDADAAIQLLEKRKSFGPDLVVIERDLPGRSGLELLAALRLREGLAGLPAIVVSSRNSRRDVLEALEAGADAYLLKPLDQEALLSRATAVLEARNAADEPAGADDGIAALPEGPPAVRPAETPETPEAPAAAEPEPPTDETASEPLAEDEDRRAA